MFQIFFFFFFPLEVLLSMSFILPFDTPSLSAFLTQKNLCLSGLQEQVSCIFKSNFKSLAVTSECAAFVAI